MSKNTSYYISWLLVYFVLSCSAEMPSTKVIEITELTNFETLVSLESETLALPVIIKVRDHQGIIVYDVGKGQVLELDESGAIANTFGRKGRGPGEYLLVKNIFLTGEDLYIIETAQMVAHQYGQGGDLISTFDFGKIVGNPTTPPPIAGGVVKANEIDNQPFVTLQGNLLLSNVNTGTENRYLFQLIDWEEANQLSEIGEVPEGSSFILDNQKLRTEALDGDIPSFYKANSFPVQDRANPDEFFIIYSSLSKIAKYTSSGEKLWENDIHSEETDAIRNRFFAAMDRMRNSDIRDRVALKFYSSGVSNHEGDLYLVTNTKPVVIHQFNSTGELVHKYVFASKEVAPVLDIDFLNNRIFTATDSGEIRIYPFDKDQNS